jgi:hypothetical protein
MERERTEREMAPAVRVRRDIRCSNGLGTGMAECEDI